MKLLMLLPGHQDSSSVPSIEPPRLIVPVHKASHVTETRSGNVLFHRCVCIPDPNETTEENMLQKRNKIPILSMREEKSGADRQTDV